MKPLHLLLLTLSSIIISTDAFAMAQRKRAWRDELYQNAFLRASFAQLTHSIDEEIAYARAMDYENKLEFNTSRTSKILYDWVYTLDVIEEKLLRKVFHQWTLDDIRLCAASLSRLSEKVPAAFRAHEEHRVVRDFTAQEKKDYFPLLKKFLKDFHEKHGSDKLPELYMVKAFYPVGAACFHTTPADIEIELKEALEKAQIAFKDNYENWDKSRETIFITIASQLALDIMRIRPFKQATVRLGLMLTFVLFKQAGLVPVPVKKRADYMKALVKSLRNNDAQRLVAYWKKALSECSMAELLKELDADSASLWPVSSEKSRTDCIIPCDDSVLKRDAVQEAQQAYALEIALGMLKHKNKIITVPLCDHPECLCRIKNVQTEIDDELNRKKILSDEKQTIARSMESIKEVLTKIKLCGNCGKSENGIKLLICSKCKYEYYCGKECQKEDWPNHKLVCFPPEINQ